MEWEVGQLPTDPLVYASIDNEYYYYWTYFEQRSDQSSSSVVLDDTVNLIALTDRSSSRSLSGGWNDVVVDETKRRRRLKVEGLELWEVQRYFDRPIAEAAKELRVGLTVLKKRCRKLGIKRWPHRKIRSINSLIHNLEELGLMVDQDNWESMLEEQRKMVETHPHLDLNHAAKKIRQKCFKALYYANNNRTTKKSTSTSSSA